MNVTTGCSRAKCTWKPYDLAVCSARTNITATITSVNPEPAKYLQVWALPNAFKAQQMLRTADDWIVFKHFSYSYNSIEKTATGYNATQSVTFDVAGGLTLDVFFILEDRQNQSSALLR